MHTLIVRGTKASLTSRLFAQLMTQPRAEQQGRSCSPSPAISTLPSTVGKVGVTSDALHLSCTPLYRLRSSLRCYSRPATT